MPETNSAAASAVADSAPDQPGTRRRTRALVAAGVGTAIEYYDFTCYAFLATALASVFFTGDSTAVALLSTFAVFAVSFFLRPVGGILIGHLADRIGRKRALTVSVVGMAAASLLIGVLPGYRSIGVAAPVALVVLRVLQGLSAGGEMSSAASYVAEESPARRRGYFTSFVNLGTIAGTLGGSLAVALVRLWVPDAGVIAWGWRIPFLVSLPLGIIALIIRSRMDESLTFEESAGKGKLSRAPIRDLFRINGRGVFDITVVNLSSFAAYYLAFTYIGTYFQTQHVMSSGSAAWATTVTLILAGITLPFYGKLSDRYGRKRVLISTNIAFIIVAYPAFALMSAGPVAAVIALVVVGQLEAVYMSTLLATYAEMFPVSVRVTGFGLGYNFSSILAGGTADYVATWLISVTGSASSPAIFLIVAAACSLAAAFFIRETAGQPLPAEA